MGTRAAPVSSTGMGRGASSSERARRSGDTEVDGIPKSLLFRLRRGANLPDAGLTARRCGWTAPGADWLSHKDLRLPRTANRPDPLPTTSVAFVDEVVLGDLPRFRGNVASVTGWTSTPMGRLRDHGSGPLAVMHTVWTLTGPDAMIPVPDLVAALENSDPDAALSALTGRDVESEGWRAAHLRSTGLWPASLVELRSIRRELEVVQSRLEILRFKLASALYCGRPAGARRVLNPENGQELIP